MQKKKKQKKESHKATLPQPRKIELPYKNENKFTF